MQKVIHVPNPNPISSEKSVKLVNKKITELADEGWRVILMSSNTAFFGTIVSFTLLIERE